MELSLKIDLTDEQYKDLMEKSFDKVMSTEEIQDAIGKLITESMANYIKDHSYLVEEYLGVRSNSYYRDDYSTQESRRKVCKMIVENALKDYSNDISEAIKDTLKSFLSKVNFDDIFKVFFMQSMLAGFETGLQEHKMATETRLDVLEGCTHDLRQRLGLEG